MRGVCACHMQRLFVFIRPSEAGFVVWAAFNDGAKSSEMVQFISFEFVVVVLFTFGRALFLVARFSRHRIHTRR